MTRLTLVMSCAMAVATAAGAQLPVPTAQAVDMFRQTDGILPALVAEEPLLGWDRALKRELASGTAEAAADRLPETLSDGEDVDAPSGGTAHAHAPWANEFLQAQLAAAYLVAGRSGEARAMFTPLRHAGDIAAAMACADQVEAAVPAGRAPPRCPRLGAEGWRLVLLDHALNHGRDDPYPIAEALIAGPNVEETGVWAELVCGILNEARYADVCGRLREATRHDGEVIRSADAPPDPFAAALASMQPPELASASALISRVPDARHLQPGT